METLELREWGPPRSIDVTESERAALAKHSRYIAMRSVGDRTVELKGNDDFVGGIVLSDRLRVVVRPKVGIAGLLEMIMLGAGLHTTLKIETDRYDQGTALDWLAYMIVLEVQKLLRNGIRNGYVHTRERLQVVRGRIDFKSMSRRHANAASIVCRYAPFVIDTAENRIIKYVLESLRFRHSLMPSLKLILQQTAEVFQRVSYSETTLTSFDRISLNRLNRQYEAALTLCRVFIQGAGLDFEDGLARGSSFFISMNELFEKALIESVRRTIAGTVPQRSMPMGEYVGGGPYLPFSIKPDVTIVRAGMPLLVVDAKYKKPIENGRYGNKSFNSANIYQLMAYCSTLRCPGILVYPQVDEAVDVTMALNGWPCRIVTVDLGSGAAAALSRFASDLSRDIEAAQVA